MEKVSKKTNFLLFALITLLTFLIILNIKNCINAGKSALFLWATNVVPSLFPFIFISKLLSSFDFIENIANFFGKIFSKFFNCSNFAFYVLFMSLICGYPIGAKVTSDLYNENKIKKVDVNKFSTFCMTSGLLFCLGTIGIGMFNNFSVGLIIFISIFLSSLINGFIFRNCYKDNENIIVKNFNLKLNKNILYDSMYNSVISILIVGGYIVIFAMITQAILSISLVENFLNNLNYILNLDSNFLQIIFQGIMEMTSGSALIVNSSINLSFKVAIVSSFIAFGGLSVLFQTFAFLGNELKKQFYLINRIVYGIISFVISLTLCCIFL